ncbi:hypothetical protein BMS3Bbin06_01095 [bacterium BMS3Bbin06]|nr:hypothetical protein BMS3Abin08_00051 [bacterium BMS3Abin08]GBE34569.1 hypothetical protein BMS3Bbin06_01095 [bacterium BMS3Bbin06]
MRGNNLRIKPFTPPSIPSSEPVGTMSNKLSIAYNIESLNPSDCRCPFGVDPWFLNRQIRA